MILVSLAQRMRRLLRRWLAPGVYLALLWLLGAVLPAQAARLALVIGNDQYTSIERLKNARNDAKLISGVLKQAGFEVTLINDQSRIQLWSAIDSFKGRINKGDEVVFYFAGHGVQIGANQLLLPTDIKARSEAEVQRDGVPLVDIQDALKDARVAVLLIDACRDNPFPKQGTRSVGNTRGLSPPEPSTGQIIMLSAGRNQKALDSVPGQSTGNGLFTWELAQLIQTPGLEIRQALEQVKDRVDDKARQANHQQRPSVVSDLRGNFFFIAPGANVTTPVSPTPVSVPTATPAPTARPVSTDPDTALWNAVETGGTADDYGVYIKQYPKGKFVALAKQRMHKLQSEAANANRAAEETAWQSAESGGTQAGYQSYLSAYPQGRYAALVQPRMNKLKVQTAERERLAAEQRQQEQTQAAQREEVALWQSAQSGDKAQVQNYFSRYPGGQYASAANARLEQIKAEEAKGPQVGQVFKDCAECPAMVVLPAGSFMMGSSAAEQELANAGGAPKGLTSRESPQHSVSIARPFAMGKFEVTQGQWKAVMGSNPSKFTQCGDDCPVENVSWNDAQSFIQKLNAKTDKNYRLPSEAEWEYACRSGGRHKYCGSDNVDAVGWYKNNSGSKTPPVGSKQANAWGLYDMSGNVWEWVQDGYHGNYNGAPTDGSPWERGGSQKSRVLRGGSWIDSLAILRSAHRFWSIPDGSYNFSIGFRLARTLVTP